MLYAFGVGEAAISISGDPGRSPARLVHTIRAVGKVSEALTRLKAGDPIGVRGPFGRGWPVEEAAGSDVVVVAGGLGLAPLRPAIYRLLAERAALRPGRPPLRHAQPGRHPLRARARALAAPARHRGRGHRRPRRRRLARQCRRRDDAHPARRLRSRSHRRPGLRAGGDDALRRRRARRRRASPTSAIYVSMERNMKCAIGLCGHCQFGPTFVCKDGPVVHLRRGSRRSSACGRSEMARRRKPKLAVWKFASCDGCQLIPARLRGRAAGGRRRGRDRLFPRGDAGRRSKGPTTCRWSKARSPPPHDAERIREVRRQSQRAGHHRRLRHRRRHPGAAQLRRRRATSSSIVYARPEYISTLATSTPIAAHVPVDFELRGCPINKHQLRRGDRRLPRRAQAGDAAAQRLHRVQAARAMSA